jgi:hypothetical protein
MKELENLLISKYRRIEIPVGVLLPFLTICAWLDLKLGI